MCISSLRVSTVKWASSLCKAGIVILLLQATSAAAYDFNLSGASGDTGAFCCAGRALVCTERHV